MCVLFVQGQDTLSQDELCLAQDAGWAEGMGKEAGMQLFQPGVTGK